MARIGVNDIKKDNILEYKDRLWVVVSREHVKPGKGGAFVQAELKDIISGTKINERFRSEETVEKARIDEIAYEYLFPEDENYVFMHTENSEQEAFNKKLLNNKDKFLQNNMVVKISFYDNKPMWINLPETAICEIAETEPVIKGQTASSSFKPAILDNGERVMVPPFVNIGEKIVVRIEDVTYVERAKHLTEEYSLVFI